ISGQFTLPEVKSLVRDLNYGALPVPITLIAQQTIGPSLGQAAVDGGVKAGVISFIIISLFLLFWYRLPGLVAVVALGVYTVIMLALFKLIPVTLTAAGIAGFIITIGMAVDANILIFERMKEELARGRGIWDAMHEGFARAWLSIRDSNISSIITAVILYYFGSSSVITGFALVFGIGVLVSMFTAITASRLFLYAVAPAKTTKLSTFLISNGFGLTK
ncbi:MAG: SecD/SecF family protein translocase subunit, partial [bacterium]|nr:SecD/SecF family protein translocase subunit [bacterium]